MIPFCLTEDCQWAEWGTWTDCKAECNDTNSENRIRTRTVDKPAVCGGLECVGKCQ